MSTNRIKAWMIDVYVVKKYITRKKLGSFFALAGWYIHSKYTLAFAIFHGITSLSFIPLTKL